MTSQSKGSLRLTSEENCQILEWYPRVFFLPTFWHIRNIDWTSTHQHDILSLESSLQANSSSTPKVEIKVLNRKMLTSSWKFEGSLRKFTSFVITQVFRERRAEGGGQRRAKGKYHFVESRQSFWKLCLSLDKPITYLYSSTKIHKVPRKIYIFLIELPSYPTFSCQ